MLKQFLEFIKKEKLVGEKEKVLLMVSGGVDSVVMSELFHRSGLSFGIAHCNFNLRGKESDEDEDLVKGLAGKYKVPFYKRSFQTQSFAKRKKLSIQSAARELRYDWLKQLAKEKGYSRIATAHHLDDSIETFFINLLRGTGITGLQGVPVKQGIIIRPILFANKKLILEFAEKEKLNWREDKSNLTDKYLRNNIRHHLIPSLKKLNEGFEKTITKELSYFKDAGDIFKKFIETKKKEILSEEGKNIRLSIKKLKESGYAETILHELLRAYDFTPETTELIAQRLYSASGKRFLSPTYRLIKDRDFLILTRHGKEKEEEFFIEKGKDEFRNKSLCLKIDVLKGGPERIKDKRSSIAYLDEGKLKFPLKLRKWKQGDYFFPLGMSGKKKLSDFFIDRKLSLNDKEDTWILESGNDIVWLIGYRIDNRYKVVPSTKKIFVIEVG